MREGETSPGTHALGEKLNKDTVLTLWVDGSSPDSRSGRPVTEFDATLVGGRMPRYAWGSGTDLSKGQAMEMEPTVFVVDADGPSCDAVCELARMMSLQSERFASGEEFLEAYDNARPGCVVLDVKVPGINGLQVQQQLSEMADPPPVVFVSGHCEIYVAVRAMKAGAVSFLEKPFREHELWDAIQEAVALDRQQRAERAKHRALDHYIGVLTFKEHLVLELLSEGKSNRTIARELGISVRTVENRRAKLMKKLGIKSPTELLHLAILVSDGSSRRLDRILDRTNRETVRV